MPFGTLGSLILGGSSLLGAGIGALGASSAASTEASAAEYAANLQMQEFQQTQKNEAPYMAAGGNALTALQQGLNIGPGTNGSGTGPLNAPFNPSNLAQTPGYQFTLGQGEQAINSAATATGGVGGANTLKALGGFAEGVADTTYQQQLQDYMAQQQQQFGQLDTVAGSGQNAAANLGALGNQAAATAGQDVIAAGNANAAGTLGVTNALGGGVSSLSSTYLLSTLLNGGGFGGGGFSAADAQAQAQSALLAG